MSKAFTRETDVDDEPLRLPDMPLGVRNYITPSGYLSLKNALAAVTVQATRSGNTDQIDAPGDAWASNALLSGGSRTHEIDQRIRYLRARLDLAEVVDPAVHAGSDQIFFGATVRYLDAANGEHTVTIVGLDEIDPANGRISWLSPIAQALLKAREGDTVELNGAASQGAERVPLRVTAVDYPAPSD